MNRFSTQNILTIGVLSLGLVLTGCLTDDDDDDGGGGGVLVTTKNLKAGAQANATYGSSIDLDNFTAYTVTTAKTRTETIDIIFANSTSSTSSLAVYSPHAAKAGVDGSNGFDFMQTGWTTANTTSMKTVAVSNINLITTKAQIDSLWSAGSAIPSGKLNVGAGTTFMAQSNEGLVVLVKVTEVETGNAGTAEMTGVAKF
jgi:hypothetical protein